MTGGDRVLGYMVPSYIPYFDCRFHLGVAFTAQDLFKGYDSQLGGPIWTPGDSSRSLGNVERVQWSGVAVPLL